MSFLIHKMIKLKQNFKLSKKLLSLIFMIAIIHIFSKLLKQAFVICKQYRKDSLPFRDNPI